MEVQSLSLEEALEHLPTSLFQYRLLLMCGFTFMSDALEVNLLSFIGICAGDDWSLDDQEKATITSVVFMGIVVGSCFWGIFADRYGRRSAYLIASSIIAVGGLLSGAAPSYGWLIFLRALAGFGVGGAAVSFDLLAEFIPTSQRGIFLIYIEFFWTIGSMFVSGMAWATLSTLGWRFLTYMSAVPVTLTVVYSFIYLPESPRWLLLKGRREDAEKVIRDAAEVNGVVMPAFKLKTDFLEGQSEDAGFFDLISDPDARRVSIPLWTVWFCFGVTYYGIILLTSRLYDTSDREEDSGQVCSFDYSAIFVNASAELIGVAVVSLVVDGWGRAKCQGIFYFLGGLAVFFLSLDVPTTALLSLSMLGRLCAMAASITTWVSTPELYNTEMRTIGHSVCSALSKIGSFLAPYLVISHINPLIVGIVLGLINILAALVSIFFIPETSGHHLDELKSISNIRTESKDYRDTKSFLHLARISSIDDSNGLSAFDDIGLEDEMEFSESEVEHRKRKVFGKKTNFSTGKSSIDYELLPASSI